MRDDVVAHQLRNYTITVDLKTNAITHYFELHVTKKEEVTRLEARNMITNFKVDSLVNVVMAD